MGCHLTLVRMSSKILPTINAGQSVVGIKILKEIVGEARQKRAEEAVSHFPIKFTKEIRDKAMILKVWVPEPTAAVIFLRTC